MEQRSRIGLTFGAWETARSLVFRGGNLLPLPLSSDPSQLRVEGRSTFPLVLSYLLKPCPAGSLGSAGAEARHH
jgi:hypothetical protein